MKNSDLHMIDGWCEHFLFVTPLSAPDLPRACFWRAQLRGCFKFVAIVSSHVQEEVLNRREETTGLQQRSVNSKPLTGIFLTHFTHVFTPHCGSKDSRLSAS